MSDLAAIVGIIGSMLGALAVIFLVACLTVIPWGVGIAHMWGSIFG